MSSKDSKPENTKLRKSKNSISSGGDRKKGDIKSRRWDYLIKHTGPGGKEWSYLVEHVN